MAIEMELSRILIREITDAQFIELREIDGERTFPIVVGKPEAHAIDRRLKGLEPPRPQTHDLLATMMQDLGGSLERILIDDLRDGTFYAKLYVQQEGIELAARDTVLLGTDGLWDNLFLSEIVELIRAGELLDSAEKLARTVIERMESPVTGQPSKPDDVSFILYRPNPFAEVDPADKD